MGKCCLHASLIIFDQIIIKVAGNQDRHKSSVEFDFGPNQTTHFGVTCPWVTKISHFWTWISLKPAGQSWSNFICSIIRVGERLLKVLGQIDFGTLDSGERSLPFGLLVLSYDRSSLIWVCTVCPDMSVRKLRKVMVSVLAHAQPLNRDRDVALCLKLSLVPNFVCAYSKCSWETVQMYRLAWAYAGHLCDKYPFYLNIICINLFELDLFKLSIQITSNVCHVFTA